MILKARRKRKKSIHCSKLNKLFWLRNCYKRFGKVISIKYKDN